MSALLSVKNLRIDFVDSGRVTNTPVRGIDLEVGPGEIIGVVGESGCGKTLTGLAVLGLLPGGATATGSVLVDGKDQLAQNAAERRGEDVSIVFQNPGTAFNPVFTIGEQLRNVVRRHRNFSKREENAHILKYLTLVQLPDPARAAASYPHELSGGMLQRAMIAMALLCEPKLLILDEPTTALDVTVAKQILELVLELQRQFGFSVLLITHNLGIVHDICDRVAVLYAGRVIELGETAEVLKNPKHPYTQGLLDALPGNRDPNLPLAAIRGTVPSNLLGITGCAFADRCPLAIDDCRETDPVLLESTAGHADACIRTVHA
ncbi:Oligopeptide transport ATP-binding protein OppD [Leifsonia rubra CMS 76R]|nr:Oligopeptide transport ATP-binding protein OppD [Leifsonia rubra CMS 76R]